MKKFEFKDLQSIYIEDIYVVTYNDKIITLDGNKITFSSETSAKNRLQKVIFRNYQQGHYWHKDKDNTFSEEGGLMRNGGSMKGLDTIFKKLGKELTEDLLIEGVFEIKKLQ